MKLRSKHGSNWHTHGITSTGTWSLHAPVPPMTSTGEQAPWHGVYAEGLATAITPPHATMMDVWQAALMTSGDRPAIHFFDNTMTFGELDNAADALATALTASGFRQNDRFGLFVQNDPSFLIGLLAAWKAGGIAVAINPMNKARELTHLLSDSECRAVLCLDTLYESVTSQVLGDRNVDVSIVITTSANDFQSRDDIRVLAKTDWAGSDHPRLTELLREYAGQRAVTARPEPGDAAVLTYTSGTTGVPKAAVNTHYGMAFNSYTYREWMSLSHRDTVLAIAPLFHITGLVGHIGAAMAAPCPLVLTHRFHPEVVLDALIEHRPSFTVAAISALNSLLSISQNPARDFSSLRAVYSGGAPIAPAVADEFRRRAGRAIHNIYGLTETTSPSHATPLGAHAPVDPQTGALSVGVPVFNTIARVLDDAGQELPPGRIGEIAVRGPQVIPSYWNRPDESAEAIVDGELRTGDIGYMNEEGWFFIIDRKKDMINASGYKVWPREIEDVLCSHPAVREAAVVGVPHPYRGETVKAFVSLKPGVDADSDELISFCKDNMAAYKYPREIDICADLPRTNTGKVLRRQLRDND